MAEPKFRIFLEGVEDDALRAVDKVVASLNKAKEATTRYSRERQQLARAERQDRFRSLSAEEQYQRLLQKRETLERRIAQARARGQDGRAEALALSLARNRSALGGMPGPSAPPVLTPNRSGLGGMIGGALASRMGFLAGGAFGAIGAIGSLIATTVRSALHFSDQINDMADQSNLSVDEILRVRRSAGASGVSTTRVLSALSSMSGVRSSALSGDAAALGTFSRFGISPEMLAGDTSPLELAQLIQTRAASSKDGRTRADLGRIFGKNPEQIMAVLGGLGGGGTATSELAKATKIVGDFNTKLEAAGVALQNFAVLLTGSFVGWLKDLHESGWTAGLKTFVGEMSKYMPGANNALTNWMLKFAGTAYTASGVDDENDPSALPVTKKKKSQGLTIHAPQSKAAKDAKQRAMEPLAYGLPVRDLQRADDLARMGFFRGAREPEGIGLMRKQLKLIETMVKAQKENTKTMETLL